MASSRKIVVRFNFWYDPAMEERFAREPDIELRTCDLQVPRRRGLVKSRRGACLPDLRGEGRAAAPLVRHGRAARALPQAPLRLLHGCRLRHSRCRSLHQGRRPGGQPGGRQRPVGCRARHRPDARLSRRISEGDRLLRRERGFSRENIMGREMSGKAVGLVGIGHIGTQRRRLARAFSMTVLAYDPYLTEEEIARRGAVSVTMRRVAGAARTLSHCTARATTARSG